MAEVREDAAETVVSTRTQSRKRQRKQQHQTRIGVHDSTNDLQFYEVSVPVEENPVKKLKVEEECRGIDGVFSLYPDMTGDNGRRDFSLSKRQLKQLSKLKLQQKTRLDDLDEHNRFLLHEGYNSRKIQEEASELSSLDDLSVSKTEEEEILERAELYALTAAPDPRFYILESQDAPLDLSSCSRDFSKDLKFQNSYAGSSYNSTRKRKRRSYNNINCYVTHHNKKDASDNTQMLPEGTRLIKPPNKLVELVAQVLDSSPDGLLQVQHIYTVLQNKYPYFRYMDKSSINSWRSSIRHALYQKWFKKVRFQTDAINSKGCFWAINRKYNPKEWTMPGNDVDDDGGLSLDDDGSLDLDLDLEEDESLAAVACMLADCDTLLENDSDYGSEEQQDFSAQDVDCMKEPVQGGRQFSLPATLKSDPDPILTSCSPINDEPRSESKSPQYVTQVNTPVLSFPEESSTYHMDNHCIHDWNVPIWEAENCHHYSQLNYSQPPVYCWDYMSAAYPSVCSDHMDSNISMMDAGIPYSYPMQPYMDDHCFS
ncbi:uncharacterized protein LOC135468675 [Liolophura sinensis]|uniref:uncharacterized protein LOC135468675 n=1 Tax=Liolophura sinensis TaxID=3198878 RepID=UPI003158865E